MVTWCFELTREVPLRRFFTSCTNVKDKAPMDLSQPRLRAVEGSNERLTRLARAVRCCVAQTLLDQSMDPAGTTHSQSWPVTDAILSTVRSGP